MRRAWQRRASYSFIVNRREWLRLAGLGATQLVIGCGDDINPAGLDEHAAAVLEPDADSFLVAIWSSAAKAVALEVRVGGDIVLDRAVSLDARGLATVDVTGLAPATSYQLALVGDTGARLGPYQVRTAPTPD